MNEEKIDLILSCMSILLSDPDGNNGEVRMILMKKITDALHPKKDELIDERDSCLKEMKK